MKKWVCKKCGLYKRIKASEIKPGQKVFFIKFERHANKINGKVACGEVLSRHANALTLLSKNIIFVVKDTDVYPKDAPVYFIYNMFGECDC
ncbi:hypothetical protein [Acinetobacter sp. WC-323]|uniref:hypothetical protein n=1 Tax=Acinetobacter sp. WC-323 TaxID=903918 RepID=UPI000517EE04|nr:hypothetical protein [Acinetobacter sp. WC-323]